MTQHIGARSSPADVQAILDNAPLGETVVFLPGERWVSETIRLPEGRSYVGHGCILRATPDLTGPVLSIVPMPHLPLTIWQRLWRWVRTHVFHRWEGPRTSLVGFTVIAAEMGSAQGEGAGEDEGSGEG